ncbi:MAG: pilus assembly protein [Alphaproteobacteria bacterium]|nr:pilus assembly protein [Alphaproteobacteria bacterium]
MPFGQGIRPLRALLRAFARARKGNIAITFALLLVPIAVAAGAGLDFSRALIVRARLSEALDAAGLAVGATSGLSTQQMQTMAQDYFNANYTADKSFGTPAAVTVTPGNGSVTVSTSVDVPMTLMNLVGYKSMPVSASSQVVWGSTKLWVALVLDNTGSMTETDRSGTSKISALKTASHQLLTMLQTASANPGDVKVSIVPFNRDVNVGSSNYSASWIDWTAWDAANSYQTYTNCNGGSGGNGYYSNNWGYSGSGSDGSYSYGGTNYSNRQNCTVTTVVPPHSTWNGCIMDRTQNYDTLNTTPDPTNTATLFPSDQYNSCPLQLMALSDDWTALGNEIDNMYAGGNTNQTIGLAWGWQTLTDGDPMNAGTLPQDTQQVIILLSDGLNTQNRWTTNESSIDAREKLACDNAKAAGVIIYTVFVDLNGTSGNSAPLQYCASSSSKYFDLTTSGAIVAAFNTIGQQITNLRVAK